MSLRARLALWYTAALVVVLVMFGVDVLLAQHRLGIVDGACLAAETSRVSR
jgi:hypothetical protein